MEKLKIYVTPRIAQILLKDTEGFEFYKRDGSTLNRNALLTKLIVNYYKNFAEEQQDLFSFLKDRLSDLTPVGEKNLNHLCFDLCERLNERSAAPKKEKFNVLISLKPTRESLPVLEFIEQYSLTGRTLSEYFRSMFASYAALPQDKREEIIFRPQYETLAKAIREKKKVFITTKGGKQAELSPYAITRSKEELHLYLIGVHNRCLPYRLSRILSVTCLSGNAEFSYSQTLIAEKMIKYGPQFVYRDNEPPVVAELTQKGIEKYKNIYVHRPVYVKNEKNIFYFECSHAQIVQYFIRFGEDVKILSPQEIRDTICRFHRRALHSYQNDNTTENEPENALDQ